MGLSAMIRIVEAKGSYLHLELEGRLSSADLATYYGGVAEVYRGHGRVHLRVDAHYFDGYNDPRAIGKLLLNEPKLLWQLCRYDLHTNQLWLQRVVKALGALVFWIDVRTYLV